MGGVNDNAYHYTSHGTLKAHLLSIYFSITLKKSSALRAYKKNEWLLSAGIYGRICHQRIQPQETHKTACNVLTLSGYLRIPYPLKIALQASCAPSGTYLTPTPRICTQKIERQ